MADFDLEQLKTVLDKMADTLGHTKGDSATHDELEQIKDLLRQLHKTIDTEAKGTAAENKAWIKSYFDEWDRRNPLRDLRKAVDNLGKKSDNPLRQGIGGGGLSDGGKKTGSADDNPLKNPADAVKQAGKFTKVLGSATEVMAALTAGGSEIIGWMKNNVQAYRQVLGSAEGSISTIMEMRDTAAKSQMSVDQLIAATQHEGVRTVGLKPYAALQLAVRNFGLHVGNFGLSVQQSQEVTAQYMDMAKSAGVLNNMNQDDMVHGITKLISVNQDMAGIMGKTADQARQDALKAQTDPNFNAALRGAGTTDTQMVAINDELGNMPDTFARVFKEAYANHGMVRSQDLQNAIASTPELQKLMQFAGEAREKGNNFNPDDLVKEYKSLGKSMQANKGRDKYIDDMAGVNSSAFGGSGAFDFRSQMMYEMYQANFNKKNLVNQDGSIKGAGQADVAGLKIDEIQTRFAAGLDQIVNSGIRPAFQKFGGTMNHAADLALDATKKLDDVASWLDKHPNTAMAGGGVAGALALAGQVGGAYLGYRAVKGILGRGKSALGTKGYRAVAAEGAETGEAAEAGIGTEAAAGAAGGLLMPALAIGAGGLGMYGGYQELAKGKKGWWSKLKGYGEAGLGGAAMGAGVGSIIPGLGTVTGGVVGGLIGMGTAAYSDWTHPDTQAGGIANNIAANKPAANATGSQTGGTIMDLVHLDQKMIEMQHAIHFTLNDIKKASYDQLNLMHEELAASKAATDRIARLLEESNRNTKQISALT